MKFIISLLLFFNISLAYAQIDSIAVYDFLMNKETERLLEYWSGNKQYSSSLRLSINSLNCGIYALDSIDTQVYSGKTPTISEVIRVTNPDIPYACIVQVSNNGETGSFSFRFFVFDIKKKSILKDHIVTSEKFTSDKVLSIIELISHGVASPIYKIALGDKIVKDSIERQKIKEQKKPKKNTNSIKVSQEKEVIQEDKKPTFYYYKDELHTITERKFNDQKTILQFSFGNDWNHHDRGALKIGKIELPEYQLRVSNSSLFEFFYESKLYLFGTERIDDNRITLFVKEWRP